MLQRRRKLCLPRESLLACRILRGFGQRFPQLDDSEVTQVGVTDLEKLSHSSCRKDLDDLVTIVDDLAH